MRFTMRSFRGYVVDVKTSESRAARGNRSKTGYAATKQLRYCQPQVQTAVGEDGAAAPLRRQRRPTFPPGLFSGGASRRRLPDVEHVLKEPGSKARRIVQPFKTLYQSQIDPETRNLRGFEDLNGGLLRLLDGGRSSRDMVSCRTLTF